MLTGTSWYETKVRCPFSDHCRWQQFSFPPSNNNTNGTYRLSAIFITYGQYTGIIKGSRGTNLAWMCFKTGHSQNWLALQRIFFILILKIFLSYLNQPIRIKIYAGIMEKSAILSLPQQMANTPSKPNLGGHLLKEALKGFSFNQADWPAI